MLGKLKDEIELVSRHIGVLAAVLKNQPIGIIKLAELLCEPQHRIRYSLRILENLGYIRASSTGAVATEQASLLFLHLNEDIGEIMELVSAMKVYGSGISQKNDSSDNQHF